MQAGWPKNLRNYPDMITGNNILPTLSWDKRILLSSGKTNRLSGVTVRAGTAANGRDYLPTKNRM